MTTMQYGEICSPSTGAAASTVLLVLILVALYATWLAFTSYRAEHKREIQARNENPLTKTNSEIRRELLRIEGE